jgi:hypothetical protein
MRVLACASAGHKIANLHLSRPSWESHGNKTKKKKNERKRFSITSRHFQAHPHPDMPLLAAARTPEDARHRGGGGGGAVIAVLASVATSGREGLDTPLHHVILQINADIRSTVKTRPVDDTQCAPCTKLTPPGVGVPTLRAGLWAAATHLAPKFRRASCLRKMPCFLPCINDKKGVAKSTKGGDVAVPTSDDVAFAGVLADAAVGRRRGKLRCTLLRPIA